MNIKEIEKILNEAPEGATHCDGPSEYFKFNGKYWSDYDFEGNEIPGQPDFTYQNIRQLSDLRTILSQHNRIKELESAIREVDCILGSLSND